MPNLEANFDLGRHVFDAAHDLVHFFLAERRWFIPHAHEASDSGGVAHDIPRVFIHNHVNQDVTRKHPALDGTALAVFQFDFFFSRNNHLVDAVAAHIMHRSRAMLKVFFNLVFIARIAMNDIPVAFSDWLCIHSLSGYFYLTVIRDDHWASSRLVIQV